jgi:hypothetical protein
VDVFHARYPQKPVSVEIAGTIATLKELSNERGSYCHSVDPQRDMYDHSGL